MESISSQWVQHYKRKAGATLAQSCASRMLWTCIFGSLNNPESFPNQLKQGVVRYCSQCLHNAFNSINGRPAQHLRKLVRQECTELSLSVLMFSDAQTNPNMFQINYDKRYFRPWCGVWVNFFRMSSAGQKEGPPTLARSCASRMRITFDLSNLHFRKPKRTRNGSKSIKTKIYLSDMRCWSQFLHNEFNTIKGRPARPLRKVVHQECTELSIFRTCIFWSLNDPESFPNQLEQIYIHPMCDIGDHFFTMSSTI